MGGARFLQEICTLLTANFANARVETKLVDFIQRDYHAKQIKNISDNEQRLREFVHDEQPMINQGAVKLKWEFDITANHRARVSDSDDIEDRAIKLQNC